MNIDIIDELIAMISENELYLCNEMIKAKVEEIEAFYNLKTIEA